MKEEDIAKIAFASIIRAIEELRNQGSEYECIGLPSVVEVNGYWYWFGKGPASVDECTRHEAFLNNLDVQRERK
jgi:hypothetical protein